MKAIINTKLIMPDAMIWDGAITFDEKQIISADRRDRVFIPPDAEITDAKGNYTAPGLIDIHNHGSVHSSFCSAPIACATYFLQHGETTVLPAFYCNLTLAQMLSCATRLRAVSHSGAGQIIGGIYMEGPYMNGTGSNQKSILWQGAIQREEYVPLVDELKDLVRIWAIDPARENIQEFMQYVHTVSPDAIFALGHSFATSAQCRSVKKYGVKVQTHHGDSGKAKGFAQGTIGAGCDEYTLYDPDIYAELICDENGIHVAPDMIKMVVRTKGVERIVLITDSMPADGHYTNNAAQGIAYGPDLNYDYEGHLAGSHLTLDHACRNIMCHTGCGLCHAIRFATLNPAQLLGIDDVIGSLDPGKKANLIIIDDMVNVQKVVLNGKFVV